jgi:hypothetical protein
MGNPVAHPFAFFLTLRRVMMKTADMRLDPEADSFIHIGIYLGFKLGQYSLILPFCFSLPEEH